MAVATDSHRNFLIPEHTVLQYARQRIVFYSDALRLFFCEGIIAYCYKFFNRLQAKKANGVFRLPFDVGFIGLYVEKQRPREAVVADYGDEVVYGGDKRA